MKIYDLLNALAAVGGRGGCVAGDSNNAKKISIKAKIKVTIVVDLCTLKINSSSF